MVFQGIKCSLEKSLLVFKNTFFFEKTKHLTLLKSLDLYLKLKHNETRVYFKGYKISFY